MNTQIRLTVISVALVCIALFPKAHAVNPPPDGGYPGGNTAEGQNALLSRTTGGFNTGVGAGTLVLNTGDENTATGVGALLLNSTGGSNTANGALALFNNTTGSGNTAIGVEALRDNTAGVDNTATGFGALMSNTGVDNTANGSVALQNNTTGEANTAVGSQALFSNIDGGGKSNTAYGAGALLNNTGTGNIALGANAGLHLTTGFDNIDIGNTGAIADDSTIRIGSGAAATFISGIFGVPIAGTPVVVVSNGQLGVAPSSARFKDKIHPMDKASEALLALKPVIFRYKKEIDPAGTRQLGLVAEDVERVNPDLVVRDKEGKPYSVRYDQVNAMLLNEFLKEHRKVEQQDRKLQEQEATTTELKKEIASLTATVKEQAARIQKVSAQVEASSRVARMVLNSP